MENNKLELLQLLSSSIELIDKTRCSYIYESNTENKTKIDQALKKQIDFVLDLTERLKYG